MKILLQKIRILPKAAMNAQGFTLIELMVVIVILGILATFVTLNLRDVPDEAKQTKAMVDIKTLEAALEMYRLHNGMYPGTEQGLQALVEPPSSGTLPKKYKEGGYLGKSTVPTDPWGNDFIYLSPGVHGRFDIISYGADGVPEGDGFNSDINSWEIE